MATRLKGFLLGQFRIERACLSYLLGIDGGITGGDAGQHLLMEKSGDAVGRVVNEPLLYGEHLVADAVGTGFFLTGKLREMPDTIGDKFPAFGGVEFTVFVEEFRHHHAPQLGNALLLTHPVVEIVHFLFCAVGIAAGDCQHEE